jgi:uncharacterized protein DUF6484
VSLAQCLQSIEKKGFQMVMGNHQHETDVEVIATLKGGSNHQHGNLSALLAKSITDTDEKFSTIQSPPRASGSINGVIIGRLMEAEPSRGIWVDYPDNPSRSPLLAASAITVGRKDVGKDVVLAFEMGDPTRPILVGLIHQPRTPHEDYNTGITKNTTDSINVQLDGKRLTLTADKEIVLRCGEASITLTHSGKVLIRGTYVVSRSSGVNRILGGSIQLN